MHETDPKREYSADPLAEIIRSVGRRAEPPREHYEQVFAATRQAWQRKLRSRRQKRWFALAASVAALVVTGTLIQNWMNSDTVLAARIAITNGNVDVRIDESDSWRTVVSEQALAPGTRIRTNNDSRAALTLSAGGSLRLDTGTEIVVGLNQYELIAGTLYFDSVGRTAASPIEIATPLGIVRDIGTQFEVATSDDLLRVRIRSGQIEISDSPVNGTLAGDAGTEIELSALGNSVQNAFAPDDPAWNWVESLAVAPSSESIFNYLNWIAHETGKKLEFDPTYVELAAQNVRLAGDPQGLTPLEVLRLIEDTSDFSFEFENDGTILIQRTADP